MADAQQQSLAKAAQGPSRIRDIAGAQDPPGRTGRGVNGTVPRPSTLVPTDYGAITEYDPPTLPALLLRHRGQQAPRLFIAERKQRQFLVAI